MVWLYWLVAFCSLITSAGGLFWSQGGERFLFTTLRGQIVEIYGQGLYRYDTVFRSAIQRGNDVVTLFIALPLLLFTLTRLNHGSLRVRLLQTGTLSYFLYNAISLAFGTAYNHFYPVYLAYFSASLFAFITACLSIDLNELANRVAAGFSRRLTAGFLVIVGLSVLVWLVLVIEAALSGQPPHGVESYTTEFSFFIELGVIGPSAFLAAKLLMRRQPAGYLLSAILLSLNALIGPLVVAQTWMQNLEGIVMTGGELFAFVVVFLLTSLAAAVLLINLLRNIQKNPGD